MTNEELEKLQKLLDEGKSLPDAARELGIHYNTLRFRLAHAGLGIRRVVAPIPGRVVAH